MCWVPDVYLFSFEGDRYLFQMCTPQAAFSSFVKDVASSHPWQRMWRNHTLCQGWGLTKDVASYHPFFSAACLLLLSNECMLTSSMTRSLPTTLPPVHIHRTLVSNAMSSYIGNHLIVMAKCFAGWVERTICCICFWEYIVRCMSLQKLIYSLDVKCEHRFFDTTMRWSGLQSEVCYKNCGCCFLH